jgi:hypothetical protein
MHQTEIDLANVNEIHARVQNVFAKTTTEMKQVIMAV